MRTLLLLQFILIAFCGPLLAQLDCSSYTYMQQQLLNNPRLKNEITKIEKYIQGHSGRKHAKRRRPQMLVNRYPPLHNDACKQQQIGANEHP